MFPIVGGLYLGWALGANSAANVFGTAVASRIVKLHVANLLCAVAIIVGAALQGEAGIHTLSGLTEQTVSTLLVISLAAAVTVTLMTVMSLPISTSQAIVGAIVGVGLATGHVYAQGLIKVVICWLATPIGAMMIAFVLYWLIGAALRYTPMSMLTRDNLLWGGLVVVGIYGAYALGANNVANATGIFSGQIAGISDRQLALIGGLAIALGVLTYSRRVIMAVGAGVMKLDAFTAFVAAAAMAATVHVFAFLGVPVSASQAIVGAILGVGFIRGAHAIRFRTLGRVVAAWVMTPIVALLLASSAYAILEGVKS